MPRIKYHNHIYLKRNRANRPLKLFYDTISPYINTIFIETFWYWISWYSDYTEWEKSSSSEGILWHFPIVYFSSVWNGCSHCATPLEIPLKNVYWKIANPLRMRLNEPNTNVVIQMRRTHLRFTSTKFMIIFSSNWMLAVYTSDPFQLCIRKLAIG